MKYADYAAITAEYQTGGRMDMYMESAINLANRINHPTKEMHALFTNELFSISALIP